MQIEIDVYSIFGFTWKLSVLLILATIGSMLDQLVKDAGSIDRSLMSIYREKYASLLPARPHGVSTKSRPEDTAAACSAV